MNSRSRPLTKDQRRTTKRDRPSSSVLRPSSFLHRLPSFIRSVLTRLPSRHELALVFAACVFPVHVWTIINVLREVPAWVLRLSAWQLVGVISYALLVALVESVLLFVGLVVLGTVLPRVVFGDGDGFVAQAVMIVLLTSAWAVVAHYNTDVIRLWGLRKFALWGMIYLASLGAGYALVRTVGKVEQVLRAVVERVSILSYAYVVADLAAVVVVIVRNV